MPRVSEAEREERIKRCAELVNQGLSRKDIAQQLGVSLPTVFNYIKAAKKQGLLSEDEKERKREDREFLEDFKALVDNAPVIESLVSHIDFNQSPREVLKQIEDIKRLYDDEIYALGYLALILREKKEEELKGLGIDIEVANQLKTKFANILKYAQVLFLRDKLGIENDWRKIKGRWLFNLTRDEPLIEIEIHTALETFKTRDRLDSMLRLITTLLFHCGATIHEISSNHLPIAPEELKRYKDELSSIEKIAQKALEDLSERGK